MFIITFDRDTPRDYPQWVFLLEAVSYISHTYIFDLFTTLVLQAPARPVSRAAAIKLESPSSRELPRPQSAVKIDTKQETVALPAEAAPVR